MEAVEKKTTTKIKQGDNTEVVNKAEAAEERQPTKKKRSIKKLSNATYHSPTDPDAKISFKPGKVRQLNFYGQVSVDDAHHVVT